MKLLAICFTEAGRRLGERLRRALEQTDIQMTLSCGFGPRKAPLRAWTDAAWRAGGALLFIGAAGIAVRAVAPLAAHKTRDPAVLALDECGRFCIPLLSGHIGGANALARRIGALCGAQAVLTTATDARGLFAVDAWAAQQGLCIANPERIKDVSAKLLAGREIRLSSGFPIAGAAPRGVRLCARDAAPDVVISIYQTDAARALQLVPRAAALGAGCRRGAPQSALEAAWQTLLGRTGLAPQAVRCVRSIDLKKDEPGLLQFCAAHGFAFEVFPAQALRAVPGQFTASAFVASVTGVDNVCERAAVCGGGRLLTRKAAGDGVTMALGVFPVPLAFPAQ